MGRGKYSRGCRVLGSFLRFPPGRRPYGPEAESPGLPPVTQKRPQDPFG